MKLRNIIIVVGVLTVMMVAIFYTWTHKTLSYHSEQYGISLAYPTDWDLGENQDGHALVIRTPDGNGAFYLRFLEDSRATTREGREAIAIEMRGTYNLPEYRIDKEVGPRANKYTVDHVVVGKYIQDDTTWFFSSLIQFGAFGRGVNWTINILDKKDFVDKYAESMNDIVRSMKWDECSFFSPCENDPIL